MAFDRPPIRGHEVTPNQIGGVAGRIKAQENAVLPEPRSYYVEGSATPVTTSGAAASTVLSVPVFWRPGNILAITFVAALTKSVAGQQCVIEVVNSPFNTSDLFATFEPALVTPSYTPYGTSPSSPGVATLITNGKWPLGPVHKAAHEFESSATVAGIYTLGFTIRRTVGAGTLSIRNPRAWVSTF